jgi:hypothetical protein
VAPRAPIAAVARAQATVVLAVLLSSTKRTANARLPVFAVLSANWTLERVVVMAADLSDPSYVAGVHARLWTLRRLALFGAVAAAVRALWQHVDHKSAMRDSVRELAVEIRRQSSDLSELKRVASLSPLSALPTTRSCRAGATPTSRRSA